MKKLYAYADFDWNNDGTLEEKVIRFYLHSGFHHL